MFSISVIVFDYRFYQFTIQINYIQTALDWFLFKLSFWFFKSIESGFV